MHVLECCNWIGGVMVTGSGVMGMVGGSGAEVIKAKVNGSILRRVQP